MIVPFPMATGPSAVVQREEKIGGRHGPPTRSWERWGCPQLLDCPERGALEPENSPFSIVPVGTGGDEHVHSHADQRCNLVTIKF